MPSALDCWAFVCVCNTARHASQPCAVCTGPSKLTPEHAEHEAVHPTPSCCTKIMEHGLPRGRVASKSCLPQPWASSAKPRLPHAAHKLSHAASKRDSVHAHTLCLLYTHMCRMSTIAAPPDGCGQPGHRRAHAHARTALVKAQPHPPKAC